MDEPISSNLSDQSFRDAVGAAHRLVEDAHSDASAASPAAEARLHFANNLASQVTSQFADLDVSDNKFLGLHELKDAAKSNPGVNLLLNHYDEITPLYYDHQSAYKSTINLDYLGISKGDLSGLKAATSSNYDDLKSFAWKNAIDTVPGGAGFILGGVIAGTSAITGLIGTIRPRSGLIGLGIGLGILGAGELAGYFTQKGRLDNLRTNISKDNSLDSLIGASK